MWNITLVGLFSILKACLFQLLFGIQNSKQDVVGKITMFMKAHPFRDPMQTNFELVVTCFTVTLAF